MQAPWLNSLGDWNPQFLRECRGRLKPRSVVATITVSFLIQLLMFLSYWQKGELLDEKVMDWSGLWVNMTWFMAYGLIIVGSYFLINDITQEDRLGTLNFIRLSPRPGRGILLGKLLGVPILPCLGVALALPLHLIAAFMGLIPPALLISVYVMVLAGASFFFSVALLFGLLSGSGRVFAGQQSTAALLFIFLLLFAGLPSYMGWNFTSVWRSLPTRYPLLGNGVQWMFLPIQTNIGLAHMFTLLTLAIGIFFIWRMLLRRFLIPRATLMSKPISYALVATLEIWTLGFMFNDSIGESSQMLYTKFGLVYLLNYGLFLVLMFVLCPGRQEVLDWLRFRSSHPVADSPSGSRSEGLSLQAIWRDLIWADGSPGVLAITLNLLIANALIVPSLLLIGRGQESLGFALLSIATISAAILIEAAAVQWIFTAQIRNPGTWAAGIVAIWLIVPIAIINLLRLTSNPNPVLSALLTLIGFPFADLAQPVAGNMIIGFVLQILLLGFLVMQLIKRLQQLTANLTISL